MFKKETLPNPDTLLSVSELNGHVNQLLKQSIPWVWLQGELSNLTCPSSGHWYFTLKDAKAQIRCAMFRHQIQRLGFKPKHGDQLQVLAKVGLYEARGDFQLVVETIQEAGNGRLQQAFEKLKKALAKAGLFAVEHKRKLPSLPRRIGVVTSPTGAAIRDILAVLNRRFPTIPVLIYPTSVQGNAAAQDIVEALTIANARQECDVLILARGGGSLEDLFCFNEEIVARAIFNSTIPIISGIGHEIDTTIADFVADERAATPSAAAERVAPEATFWQAELNKQAKQLSRGMQLFLFQRQQHVQALRKQLRHPAERLQQQQQTLDQWEHRLQQALQNYTERQRLRLSSAVSRFQQQQPTLRLLRHQQALKQWQTRLQQSVTHNLFQHKQRFQQATQSLDMISPLATLQRGYSILTDPEKPGKIIRHAKDTRVGRAIKAQLGKGVLLCKVQAVEQDL